MINENREKPETQNSFADRLCSAMEHAGMSQAELSNVTGISKGTISRYLQGKFVPKQKAVVLIAKALNVSTDFLVQLVQLDIDPESSNCDNKLGEKIRAARLAKGMTQEELGHLLGVEKSAVAKYENGRVVNLKQATLKSISQILDIPVSELIAGSGEQQELNVNKDEESTLLCNKEILEILLRLHTDAQFLEVVSRMSALDGTRLNALKQLLISFGE